ncbi:hypothetical protein JCM10212_006268 [Sporobolomyces blumeae]
MDTTTTHSLIPTALDHLADALRSLPPQSSLGNVTLLASLLSNFSSDVAPLLSVVLRNEEDSLLSNATWISDHLSQLEHLVARLPASTVKQSTHAELVTLVQFDSTKFTIWDLWTPDIWTLLVFFVIAISAKVLGTFGLRRSAVVRTQKALAVKYGHDVEYEVARSVLKKYVGSILGWILNIVIEGTCLILQLYAWRLLAITSQPVRLTDIYFIFTVIKLLLIGYAADMLLGDHGADVYLHHCFSFILLFVGQCAFFQTHNPLFFRLASWMLLQATLIIPIYIGLGLIQLQRYYQLQDYRPDHQNAFLRWAYYTLRLTSIVYIPQKVVPAAFCLYWLVKMWNDVKYNPWGVAWLVLATIVISLLLVLQVFVISDSVTAMTAYIRYRAFGGALPSRKGPIARFVARLRRGRLDVPAANETAVVLEPSEKEKEILSEPSSGATSPTISTSPSTATVFEQLPALITYKTPDSPV